MQRKILKKTENINLTLLLTTTAKSVGLLSSANVDDTGDVYVASDLVSMVVIDDVLKIRFNVFDRPLVREQLSFEVRVNGIPQVPRTITPSYDNNLFEEPLDNISNGQNHLIVTFYFKTGEYTLYKKFNNTTNLDGQVTVSGDVNNTNSHSIIQSLTKKPQTLNNIKKLRFDGEKYHNDIEIIELASCGDPECVRDYLIENLLTGAYDFYDDDNNHRIYKIVIQGMPHTYNLNTNENRLVMDYSVFDNLGIYNDYILQISNVKEQIQFQEPQFFGIDFPVDIQSQVFIERDKASPLETIYKLSEVNNILELERNGNGYFKINNISDLKI